jgi:hypothetical protein
VARDQGVAISTLGWILLAAAAWLVVATAVGLLVGRMIRERDRQVPPAPGVAPEARPRKNPARRQGPGEGGQRRT